MKCQELSQLPEEYLCNACGQSKPVGEMIVIFYKREKYYYLRPRCKSCHNERERGTRRDWKRQYQQNWRKNNKQLNDSYWKGNPQARENARINAEKRRQANHEAILIQGRLKRRGVDTTLDEAKQLLAKFGRCYPTPQGLSKKGLQECERIRATMRRRRLKRFSIFDIRLTVYEDGLLDKSLLIAPEFQPVPYAKAAKRLKEWQRTRRVERQREQMI